MISKVPSNNDLKSISKVPSTKEHPTQKSLLYLSKETKQTQQAERRAELRGLAPHALERGVVVVVVVLIVEFVDILIVKVVIELPVIKPEGATFCGSNRARTAAV